MAAYGTGEMAQLAARFQAADDSKIQEIYDACKGNIDLATELMLADAKIKSGEIGPVHQKRETSLPILEGILDVPATRAARSSNAPKFVDPSTSMILASSSSLLRTSLVHFLDSDTGDADRSIYAPRYQDSAAPMSQKGREWDAEETGLQYAQCLSKCDTFLERAQRTAIEAKEAGDEELARKMHAEMQEEQLREARGGGMSNQPWSSRACSPARNGKEKKERQLAPGRSINDPVPVKVDDEAIQKLKHDVLPFLFKRIEAVEVPPMEFDIETAIGTIHAFYSDVSVSIEFTEHSKVDIEVSRDGILMQVYNVEAHMRDAKWGFEQMQFPYLHSSGTLEADCLGGDVSLMLRCTQHGSQRNFEIEPEVVNIGRVMITVDESWSSWLYNTIIGLIKPQIKVGLEMTIDNALRQSASAINESMDWLGVLVLAVMQAEEDEAIASESGYDLMTEGKGRFPHKRHRSSGDLNGTLQQSEMDDNARHRRTQSSLE